LKILAPQRIDLLSLEEIRHQLGKDTISDQTVEQLYRHGEFMLDEVSQRADQIDHKLYSILGWSSATSAFLLLSNEFGANIWFTRGAVVFSVTSILLCSLGVKSAVGPVPSESAWFCSTFYQDPEGMKRSHLLQILDLHQRQNQTAVSRADYLARAEVSFIICVGLIVLALLQRFFMSH
jgi:hypothetical protein